MEAYLLTFMNWEQNNWARLLSIAEFTYNNCKNASTGQILFELNRGYHLWISFKNKYDACSRSSSGNKLAKKLKKLINVYCQILLYAQNLWE